MLLNPFIGVNSVGSAGVTYFFEERFEGSGYQNTWDETGSTGTIDEDYTTSPLEGSQSLLISATAQHPKTVTTLSSDQSELWAFFRMRLDATVTTTRRIFVFQNTSVADCGGIQINGTSNLAAFAGATGTATTDALSVGTDYNVWFHYKKGSGANAVASVGFSTGTTEVTSGNAYSSLTNGTATTDAHTLVLRVTNEAGTNTTGAVVFDKILVSTTGTIGDNPS